MIAIKKREESVYIDTDKEILEDYDCIEHCFYVPDFLQPFDKGMNNERLVEFIEIRDELKYLCSCVEKIKQAEWISEYYEKGDMIYAFLIVDLHKRGIKTHLASVGIYKRKEGVLIQ